MSVDAELGRCVEVELFAVLSASNYTYAEATRSQKLEDFCLSVMRTFEFFGGVPRIVVPDQLRSAVSKPDRLDPEINPTFAGLAAHYRTAVIPARPRKPRDKAKAEGAVLIVQRWIVAVLRNVKFTSLDALNLAVTALVIEIFHVGRRVATHGRNYGPKGSARTELFGVASLNLVVVDLGLAPQHERPWLAGSGSRCSRSTSS